MIGEVLQAFAGCSAVESVSEILRFGKKKFERSVSSDFFLKFTWPVKEFRLGIGIPRLASGFVKTL